MAQENKRKARKTVTVAKALAFAQAVNKVARPIKG